MDARTPTSLVVARVLMTVLGLVIISGATYFSFFAEPHEGGVSDAVGWLAGAVAYVLGVGFVIAAVRLGARTTGAFRLAFTLVIAQILYTIGKVIGYDETESITFGVVDVVILLLLWHSWRTLRPRTSAQPGVETIG